MLMFRFLLKPCLLLSAAFAAHTMSAALKLPSLFSDHMMLQGGMSAPVWGTADAGAELSIEFAGSTVSTVVGDDGAWRIELPKMSAGEAGDMTLTLVVDGQNVESRVIHDVLVGDVWLASGQSNMEWVMANDARKDEFVPQAQYPDIRFFKVTHSIQAEAQDDVEGTWLIATPESVGNFSAVAYYFARNLHLEKRIPVGVLEAAWGGTPLEPWMSHDALMSVEDTRKQVEELGDELTAERIAYYQTQVDRFNEMLDEDFHGLDAGVCELDYDDSTWMDLDLPQLLQIPGGKEQAIAWLRKGFFLDEGASLEGWKISLGKPTMLYSIYVNGHCVAKKIWSTQEPHEYELDAAWLKPGENQIAMRLGCLWSTGGFDPLFPEQQVANEESGQTIALDNVWKYSWDVEPPLPVFKNCQEFPGTLYNGMINPLVSYGLKGFIWYQGESNVGREGMYAKAFPAMIQDWRKRWGQGDLPFLYTELPNYKNGNASNTEWARLREAQSEALKLKNTARACIIEQGNPNDLHPKNKFEVGYRLSLLARELAYGDDVVANGPVLCCWEQDGEYVRVHYKLDGSKLASETPGELSGFELAGEDGVFHPAHAWIDGDEVLVSAEEVNEAKYLRYAWCNSPETTLFNAEGLPAIPYRSDEF